MKKSLALLALVAFTLPAVSFGASCGERLRAAVSGKKWPVKATRELYKFAAEAFSHYEKELHGEQLYIESAAEYYKGEKIVGYKISITDGGDESLIDYIFDGKGELISAYWHNQSPQRFWFCN